MVLLGPLAEPELRAALDLEGTVVSVTGHLSGGTRAGLERHSWPVLSPDEGEVRGIRVAPSGALWRYLAVMGLAPQKWGEDQIVGATLADKASHVLPPDPADNALRAEIARQIRDADPEVQANALAIRLPMIGAWAASRVRGRVTPVSGAEFVAERPDDAVRVLSRSQPFNGYFSVERQVLTHDRHMGGQTVPLTREVFVIGDAAVMLPWDPIRDRVLVVEQFRIAPALRGDRKPWMLEPVAGRVDAGETPEDAIRREAREEAGLSVDHLISAGHVYPSPGAICEFLYHYVGITDLPDGIAGVHGLDSEAEDIRGHLMDRSRLSAMVDAGQINNGPLVMLSLWLDARADGLRLELGNGSAA